MQRRLYDCGSAKLAASEVENPVYCSSLEKGHDDYLNRGGSGQWYYSRRAKSESHL